MALINPPAWLQQGSYPAKTDRQVIESIIPVEGVVSGLAVTQTPTASMSVNISAGKGFVAGTSVALQGMYNVINDAPSSIALPGSNVTNPRYDLIVISINDADVAGSTNSAEFKVISGVPSSSPAVPSIPPSTLVLARIYVGAGVSTITSASITDVRLHTAARGGIIQVPDAASRLRITTYPVLVEESSTGILWRNSGSGWAQVHPVPVISHAWLVKTTAFNIPPATPAVVTAWDTVDTAGMSFNNSTGTITVSTAGWYDVRIDFHWAGSTGGGRTAQILRTRSGADVSILGDNKDHSGTRPTPMIATATVLLAAGDTLRLSIVHSASTSIGPEVASQPVYFSVTAA